jgi:hypothetical protein
VKTPRGEIQAVGPSAFATYFGVAAPDVAAGARLAALRIAVRDMEAAGATLRASGIAAQSRMDRLIVGPKAAMGATVVFEPA